MLTSTRQRAISLRRVCPAAQLRIVRRNVPASRLRPSPVPTTPSAIRSFHRSIQVAQAIPTHHPHARRPHFDKILIANRGEIACRVIRTAQKLGVKTVAVYSEVDQDALHVRLADEAYCIGPALSSESYLNIDKIIDVCRRSGAQAVHPGYGFLSENSTFAKRLDDEGIVFIGPPASAIVSMGSKSESKHIMISAGVPCVPGYHGQNQDPEFLYEQAKHIGFPVLIKAIHGGGGKGMRAVTEDTKDAFVEGLSSAKREALKGFGNDIVLIEKYIERPRHVEVQVFADTLGNVVSLWERDCSVQRRNQKIIEEAPAPGLTPELRQDLGAKAVAAARAVKYVGAGTVEFIFDNDTQDFFFMEMNTRLQVEHPVTEMITGLDLVEWQLEVAAGNALPLEQSEIPMTGHAFEARIYAENPRNQFLPDSGQLLYLSTPPPSHIFAPTYSAGEDIKPSLRIEQGFEQGAQIGVFYDPMIAKVVTHGRDRTEALRVLRKALEQYHVVGVSTNVDFLKTLAGNQAFIDRELETGFIKKHFDELFPSVKVSTDETYALAALYITLQDTPKSDGTPWTTLGPKRFSGDIDERLITLQEDSIESEPVAVAVKYVGLDQFDITVRGKTFTGVSANLVSSTSLRARLGDAFMNITAISQKPSAMVPASAAHNTMEKVHLFVDGEKTTLIVPSPKWLLSLGEDVLNAGAKGALRAPMPSLVVEVKVKVGDKVEKGQVVVILESMKTETVMRADAAGVVKAVGCKNGEMVEEGRELVDIEVEADK